VSTERLLTLIEVADLLRVSTHTIRAWVARIDCGLSASAAACSSPLMRSHAFLRRRSDR